MYRIYEEALEKEDAVDFGDLIRLALELVNNNAEVQEYMAGFKHVLVDEFQDVNSASDALLRAICRKNVMFGLWPISANPSTGSAVPSLRTWQISRRRLPGAASRSRKTIVRSLRL